MADALDTIAAHVAAHPGGTAVLTGAGVSVASGITTFRSDDGFWSRYDPLEYGHIDAFRYDPVKVWSMLHELDRIVEGAEPNDAHHAIADLERLGSLDLVLTQNADGLHQRAGNSRVVELHGSNRTLLCLDCGARRHRDGVRDDLDTGRAPRCVDCHTVLKPDAVFFGESLPAEALTEAHGSVRRCVTLLVAGTSAEVNPEPVLLTRHRLVGQAETVLPTLVERIRSA